MSDVVMHREFMTTWYSSSRPPVEAWATRNKADLMASTKSTRHVPLFRAFDLLAQPNQSLMVLQNDDHRIGVESVCGAREEFIRHVDFDTVYFQFAGNTTLETEYGEYTMAPGELLLIPEGIAHRSTGTADSLRWWAHVSAPFQQVQADENHTSRTSFEVIRHNGPQWQIPAGAEQPKKGGRVRERMICWDDRPNDVTVGDRDYDYLVGSSSTERTEKVSGIRKLRAFDMFTGIAGNGRVDPLMRAPHLEIKVYNIVGEQFAFHRALRSEEVRVQFRGCSIDLSECENVKMGPGDVTVIPRGIAHSLVSDPPEREDFLRLNFYSHLPWRYPNDLTYHAFNSTFEVRSVVHEQAAWRTAAE
jgi:quercetin dioxygenase-like cupin family protein